MNRKLGQLIKAALFALPLALPGVALAQSAGSSQGSSATGTTTTPNDTAMPQGSDTKGSLEDNSKLGTGTSNSNLGTDDNAAGKMNSGSTGTSDTGKYGNTDQQNSGSLGNSTGVSGSSSTGSTGVGTGAGSTGSPTGNSDIDRNPPAGSLDTSGSSKSTDRNIGGDINKSDNNLDSDTTTTKHKKTSKKSTKSSSELQQRHQQRHEQVTDRSQTRACGESRRPRLPFQRRRLLDHDVDAASAERFGLSCSSSCSRGSDTMNVAPLPGVLSTRTSPLMSSTSSRVIHSPRPRPP